MSDRMAGAIGLLPRAFEVGVSAASRATVRPPSPGACTPGSSSHEPCRSLQRSSACRPPSACASRPCGRKTPAKSAFHEVRALFTTSASRVHTHREYPPPRLRSVLGVPPALDGFLRASPCGFVSPRSRVQGFPPGDCPSAGADRLVADRCPRVVRTDRLRLPAPAARPSPSGPSSPSECGGFGKR